MQDLTPQQKKKLGKLALHEEDASLALFEEMQEVNENLTKIAEKEVPEIPKMNLPGVFPVRIEGAEVITIKGEKGDSPTDEYLIELIKPLIPEPIKGDKGETPTRSDLEEIIKPLIPEPIKGEDGISPTEEELKDIITPLIPDPIQGSPDTAEQIREKLESLKDENRLDKSAIKGLEDSFKEVDIKINAIPRGGGVSALAIARAFKYIFHTEQPVGAIDGANLTYTVKNNIWAIIGFTLNGESIAQLPNYTFINHTITFSSALPAAYSGKDFEIKYIGT